MGSPRRSGRSHFANYLAQHFAYYLARIFVHIRLSCLIDFGRYTATYRELIGNQTDTRRYDRR